MTAPDTLRVRFQGQYFYCECGNVMQFLDGLEVPQRRIVCRNQGCAYWSCLYLEPILEASAAPLGN